MVLSEQLKEVGEWFNDNYAKLGYQFTVQYRYDGSLGVEEYYMTLEGPKDFKKMVALFIKDEWKKHSERIDQVREKFVAANKRAISQMIDGNENPELLKSLSEDMNTYKLTTPMEELLDKHKEIVEFTKDYDAEQAKKNA